MKKQIIATVKPTVVWLVLVFGLGIPFAFLAHDLGANQAGSNIAAGIGGAIGTVIYIVLFKRHEWR